MPFEYVISDGDGRYMLMEEGMVFYEDGREIYEIQFVRHLGLEDAIYIAGIVKTVELTPEELIFLKKISFGIEKEIQFGNGSTILVLNKEFYEFYKLTKGDIICYLFISKKNSVFYYKISIFKDDLFTDEKEDKIIVSGKEEFFVLIESNLFISKIAELKKYSDDKLDEFLANYFG